MTRTASRHRRSRSGARRLAAGAAVAFAVCTTATAARAQLHWDAAAQVGVNKRFLTNQPAGARDASFGPTAQLSAHVALLPLVRVGAYFGHDISPVLGAPAARDLTWGGVRAKVMSPWPRGNARAWLFVGFGVTGVYARSYHATVAAPAPGTNATDVLVPGRGGHFFEVPFGIGASYKLRKPWELFAELGMRVGFASAGSAYEGPFSLGEDRFSIGLSLGVLVDL